jgi:hypothetical protein
VAPKLPNRAKRLVKSCFYLTNNDDTSKNRSVATLAINTTITIKTCTCDRSSPRVPAHPPLTLILPTTTNLLQHVACLPAAARHAHSWLPYCEAVDIGPKLNEVADMALALQRKCAWLVDRRLPMARGSAVEMARLLGELAGKLKKQPLDDGGWETAPLQVWRA